MKVPGVVVRLVREKKFGFIRTQEGQEYFFHATMLPLRNDYEKLKEGQAVQFTVDENSSKGLRAETVTP